MASGPSGPPLLRAADGEEGDNNKGTHGAGEKERGSRKKRREQRWQTEPEAVKFLCLCGCEHVSVRLC